MDKNFQQFSTQCNLKCELLFLCYCCRIIKS